MTIQLEALLLCSPFRRRANERSTERHIARYCASQPTERPSFRIGSENIGHTCAQFPADLTDPQRWALRSFSDISPLVTNSWLDVCARHQ
jgi:hypothetical protein